MKRLNAPTLIVLVALIAFAATLSAQPYPSNRVANFYDSLCTYNGVLVPTGSIVKAYDPDNVLCGVDTFGLGPDNGPGYYGFMNVYGDQPETPSLDEGPLEGDAIHFTINDRPATIVEGDATWHYQTFSPVLLSVTGATVAMTVTETPNSKVATFNRTVQFRVGVRNDGNGLDFYHIVAANADTSFHTIAQDSFKYANPGDTVYVTFTVKTPFFTASGDTVNTITYTVNSGVDTTQKYTGTVDLYLTITDVNDGNTNLPNSFTLRQNYPNPFNPSTTISYDLPRASRVRLEIIDVLGQVIKGQELGQQSAGAHTYELDGSDLASGLYFYRLVTSYAAQSRKMLLVK